MFVRHFHPVLFRLHGPKANIHVPLFSWFSGHISAPQDIERHKKSASLFAACDFLRKFESFQIVCEARTLPLS
jgi:hypothetical protein